MDTAEPVLKSHRRPDVQTTVVSVRSVRFGDGSYPVLAGPAAVESEEQILAAAEAVATGGGAVLRAGAFLGASSPYGYRGLGDEALWLLEHAGKRWNLPTSVEILEPAQLATAVEHVDMVEIGPDNMQNFVLLRAAGTAGVPVILHRGPSATIDEWLLAAEYILDGGNDRVVLCERGSRGFDPRTTETLDISAVPVVQRMSHLPVIVDPDPSSGDPDLLAPLALAARSAGADGLMLPVHHDPANARAGNGNHLDSEAFVELMEALGIPSMRDEIDRVDRELVKMLARRLHSSVDIARITAGKGLAIRSPKREVELIAEVKEDAEALGMDPAYAEELMEVVLRHSRAAQSRALESDRAAG
jgi:3-deoxy-7-phosphoheptulonate synthase